MKMPPSKIVNASQRIIPPRLPPREGFLGAPEREAACEKAQAENPGLEQVEVVFALGPACGVAL